MSTVYIIHRYCNYSDELMTSILLVFVICEPFDTIQRSFNLEPLLHLLEDFLRCIQNLLLQKLITINYNINFLVPLTTDHWLVLLLLLIKVSIVLSFHYSHYHHCTTSNGLVFFHKSLKVYVYVYSTCKFTSIHYNLFNGSYPLLLCVQCLL